MARALRTIAHRGPVAPPGAADRSAQDVSHLRVLGRTCADIEASRPKPRPTAASESSREGFPRGSWRHRIRTRRAERLSRSGVRPKKRTPPPPLARHSPKRFRAQTSRGRRTARSGPVTHVRPFEPPRRGGAATRSCAPRRGEASGLDRHEVSHHPVLQAYGGSFFQGQRPCMVVLRPPRLTVISPDVEDVSAVDSEPHPYPIF